MNVADLELCRQLYELSGWEPKGHDYYCDYNGQTVNVATKVGEYICPAYNLGFLVRELPAVIQIDEPQAWLIVGKNRNAYQAGYQHDDGFLEESLASKSDTPENAACSLAIELFKSGVLK